MKKLSLAVCALALLTIAPPVFACAECDWPDCNFVDGFYYQCWFLPEYPEGPGGCYSSGPGCNFGGGGMAQLDLSSELAVASVEVRHGDTLDVQTTHTVIASNQRLSSPVAKR